MKLFLIHIIILCIFSVSHGQQEFHVFPKNHIKTPGTQNGTGSIANPWDLQTALSQTSDIVNSGDTIWLHQGIYNGRFVSTLQSLEPNSYITVTAFKNEKVTLNGNVESTKATVFDVTGKQVIYKNFEITFLGAFSRDEKDEDFQAISGLRHLSGVNCRFYNLIIHNIPGLGMGSWKQGGGTIIEDCMIYNNGYMSKGGKGRGEGIYVQNKSDEVRLIKNNIIFNNYYKGIEVWSAGKREDYQYVKNITLENNIIFNSGSPSGILKDNVIIATDDRNGINIAKNIKVQTNVFYHNTDVENAQISGDAASLTIGYIKNAPAENITITDNLIIGRNNALRILYAKSLRFERNRVYTGYVVLGSSVLDNFYNWRLRNNTYYTKKSLSFRISGDKDYNLERWQSSFGLDEDSSWKNIKKFDMRSFASMTKYEHKTLTYKVVLFQEDGSDVSVDFSKSDLKLGLNYRIYDVENMNIVAKSGKLLEDFKITFPMHLTDFKKPLHNELAQKTLSNFGVFVIEFEDEKTVQISEEKDNFIKRFFKWLGF